MPNPIRFYFFLYLLANVIDAAQRGKYNAVKTRSESCEKSVCAS